MASNANFGDTCPRTFKYLEAEYLCHRGKYYLASQRSTQGYSLFSNNAMCVRDPSIEIVGDV